MRMHEREGVDVEGTRRAADPRAATGAIVGLADHRPDVMSRSDIMRLQREAGNGAVSDLVEDQRSPVLDKTDRAPVQGLFVQRGCCDDRTWSVGRLQEQQDTVGLQREAGSGAVGDLVAEQRSPVLDVVSSGGSPLEPAVRTDMESRLGHDFGDVRIHTDADAHESARSVGAHAYTVGHDVVFQRDAYDPSSQAGRTTLAHELTHVVQQRSGSVDGTPSGAGISVSDPGDRFERAAAENAARVMSEPAPVQRQAEDEEEPVQGSFVQREGEEDEQEAAV